MLARLQRHFFPSAALIFLLISAGLGQSRLSLEEVISKAADGNIQYIDVFQNLVATETKTFEIFDRRGELKKRKVVRSELIVFRLSRDQERVVEFRSVLEVDGKPVRDREERTRSFFERLAKSESSAKELERIEQESFRYDPELRVSGMTLFQAIALAENIRPVMSIKITGTEIVSGRSCILLSFQQTADSEFIRVNRGDSPDPAKTSLAYEIEDTKRTALSERMRGMLWIDEETFQIRKELREITVQPTHYSHPVVISRTTALFRDSEFGILTPETIVHELFRPERKRAFAVRDVTVTFNYSSFSKPDVEVRSAEVK